MVRLLETTDRWTEGFGSARQDDNPCRATSEYRNLASWPAAGIATGPHDIRRATSAVHRLAGEPTACCYSGIIVGDFGARAVPGRAARRCLRACTRAGRGRAIGAAQMPLDTRDLAPPTRTRRRQRQLPPHSARGARVRSGARREMPTEVPPRPGATTKDTSALAVPTIPPSGRRTPDCSSLSTRTDPAVSERFRKGAGCRTVQASIGLCIVRTTKRLRQHPVHLRPSSRQARSVAANVGATQPRRRGAPAGPPT